MNQLKIMIKKQTEDFKDKFENKHEFLGKILIERNLLLPEQLQQGLALQKREGGLIGEILVRLGFLREIDVVAAIILQCGIPYIAVDQYRLDPQIVRLIPAEMARRERLIALDRAGHVLSVVMADPVNAKVIGELEKKTGYRIVKFVATPSQIKQAIANSYN